MTNHLNFQFCDLPDEYQGLNLPDFYHLSHFVRFILLIRIKARKPCQTFPENISQPIKQRSCHIITHEKPNGITRGENSILSLFLYIFGYILTLA